MWDRNTPWRQGHLLTQEAVTAFKLSGDIPPDECAVVVISHDCDLAQTDEIEPSVEVVIGRFIDGQLNGNFTHSKNLRRLHAPCTAGQTARGLEIEILSRRVVPKNGSEGAQGLADFVPCQLHKMGAEERNTLQHWLAARYRRAAFPDEFDRRLKDETGVAERLARVFKESGQFVSAVLFEVDGGEEVEHAGATDPFELRITLVYSTEQDPALSKIAATAAVAKVKQLFQSRCIIDQDGTSVWNWIELVDAIAISDEALTYAESRRLSRWHADYISLRAEPAQPLIDQK